MWSRQKGAASAGGMCCCMGGRRTQQRNVLCHGQGRGGAGGAREEPAGRKNKFCLSQGYRAAVLLVAIFFFPPSPS